MTGDGELPTVSGGASADELAAVLAALARRRPEPPARMYERWRRTRLAALRAQ